MNDRAQRYMVFKNEEEQMSWMKKCDEQAMREYSKESEETYEKWRKDGERLLEEYINDGGQEFIEWFQGTIGTHTFLDHWDYERRYDVAYEFIESMLQKYSSYLKQQDCCSTMLGMILGSLRSEIEANEIDYDYFGDKEDPYKYEYE
ncbi:hypothetical protein M9Y10_015553 [Tritrichomonas musculus]|uniref:Uncharacterized protein n=1 Tax=Tritrichomonas musculus TaxID=1915356 RepID=A0ABR2L2L3_9EUKA